MRAGPAHRPSRAAAAFLAPFLVGTAVLVLLPAVLTLRFAFTDYTGLGGPRFTGLDNVRRLASDPLFHASLEASAVHVALAVPLRLAAATALALLLAAPLRAGRWYRASVYLPTVVPDVALALLFLWLLNPVYGPVNQLLGVVGLPQPDWLSTPWGARTAVVLMLLLPIGEAFVVVVAARRQIDPRIYDAAALEGLGPGQRVRWITLPVLAPLLLLLAVRDAIVSLQANFLPAYVLTDGGPDAATLYLPLYIFDQAFEFLGFGYGALLSIVLLLVTLVVIGLQLAVVRRWRVLR